MAQKVGYKLLDPEGNVCGQWGGMYGTCPVIPNPMKLPNGDMVHCALVGEEYSSGYVLIEWWMEQEEPS